MPKKKRFIGGTSCAYRGCKSRTGSGEEISFFCFPKGLARTKTWLAACNREDLLYKDVLDLHKNYKLCEKHFEDRFISKSVTRKDLFAQAIPTIFGHLKHKTSEASISAEPPAKIIGVLDPPGVQPLVVPVTSPVDQVCPLFEIIASSSKTPQLPLPSSSKSFEPLTLEIESPGLLQDRARLRSTTTLLSPTRSTQTSAVLSSGTPRKKKLREQVRALRRKAQQAKIPKKEEWSLQDFYSMCDKFLSKPLAQIVKAQVTLKDKKPIARRYSMEYKQFALTLFFLGPRAYAFIKKNLYLPSKRCLQTVTEKLVCRPGLNNDSLFSALEIKVQSMSSLDRHCLICIDEMSLKSNLYYHTGRDEIVGVEDIGLDNKELLIAQNAAVIMARGLFLNWKQPIAYFFVNTQFKSRALRPVIEKTIVKLSQVGLSVDALVSDMGSNFIELANCLKVTPDNPEFEVGEFRVYEFGNQKKNHWVVSKLSQKFIWYFRAQ